MRRFYVVALAACAVVAAPVVSQAFPTGAQPKSCTNDVYVVGAKTITLSGGYTGISSLNGGFAGGLAFNVTSGQRNNITPEVYADYQSYGNGFGTSGGRNASSWDIGLSGRVFLDQNEAACGQGNAKAFVGAGAGWSNVNFTVPGVSHTNGVSEKIFAGMLWKGGFEVRGSYAWRPKVVDVFGNATDFSGPTIAVGFHL